MVGKERDGKGEAHDDGDSFSAHDFSSPQGFHLSFCPGGTELPISFNCLQSSLFHSCTLGNEIECQVRWDDGLCNAGEVPNSQNVCPSLLASNLILYVVEEPIEDFSFKCLNA